MKVLRVIASMDPSSGGPCQGIRNSIPALEALGVFNQVVCLDAPGADFLQNDDFPVQAIGPSRGPWKYSKNLKPWLMRHLSAFDVVIVHGLWLYHGYAVRRAIEDIKRRNQKSGQAQFPIPRVYIMPHGMLDPYFQKAPGRKFKAIRNWFYWKLVEANSINDADGVLFTCLAELKLANKAFHPYHPRNALNVGYGIAEPPAYTSDMERAFLKQCPALKNRPYLLFLSRIHEKKGVDLLLKAYADLLKLKRQTKYVRPLEDTAIEDETGRKKQDAVWPALVIAGPGLETLYGEKIQQMASKINELDSVIFFTGMLTDAAKWGAFYGCEAFVLPSHQENFGIAVAEALACNKPVLISNQVNIWQEILSGGCGLVADDTEQGIQSILQSWLSLSIRDKWEMGHKARIAYEELFAIRQHAVRLNECLQEKK